MASNNNVYNSSVKTYLNPSHLKRTDKDNGTGQILWSRDIDWGDISSNLGTLTSLLIIQKIEDLSSSLSTLSGSLSTLSDRVTALESSVTDLGDRVTALENQTPEPTKVTISNISMGATSIADDSSMNISFNTNAAATITISSGDSGTGWKATVTSSAGTSHTIKVENLSSTTASGSIAANTIKVIAVPSDTINYLSSDATSVQTSAITLVAQPVEPTKVTISNISVGSTTIADGSSMNITFKTNTNASISLETSNGTGWKATVTSSTGVNHTIKVENLTSITTAGSIAANTIKVTAAPSDTTNYLTSDSTSVQTSTITLSAKVKENPILTVYHPESSTIADGESTTITVTSNVVGKLTLTTASGTGWAATSSSTSTANTEHTITVENLTSTTTAGAIAVGGIVATFTPTDTTNYNTLKNQSVLIQAITLSAAAPQTVYYSYVGTDTNELIAVASTGTLKSDIATNMSSIPGVKTYTSVPSSLEAGITINAGNDYVYVIAPTETLNNATTYLVNQSDMPITTEVLGTFTIGTTEYTVHCTPSEVNTVITAWKTSEPEPQPQTVYYSYVGTDANELIAVAATGALKSDIATNMPSIPGVKTYTSVPSSLEAGITINAGGDYVYVVAPTATLNNATTYLVNQSDMPITTEALGTFTIGTTEYTVQCTPSEVSTVITAWKN